MPSCYISVVTLTHLRHAREGVDPAPVLDLDVDEGRPHLLHHVGDEVVPLPAVDLVLPTTAALLADVAPTTA